MRKITLAFLGTLFLVTTSAFSQTYSTGLVELSNTSGSEYSMQIDVTTAEVTLTMIGPSGKWLGLGFGVQSMTADGDVVIFDGTNLTDRHFLYVGVEPQIDDREDWTVTSNVVNSGVRTLVATRDLDTGNPGDYVFSASATSIDLVWARARDLDNDGNDFVLDWHGVDNRGITMQALTLSKNEFQLSNFIITPNPSSTKFKVSLPNAVNKIKLDVFDVLGKKIYSKELNGMSAMVDVSKWNSGVYLVRLSTDNATQTKRFVRQ